MEKYNENKFAWRVLVNGLGPLLRWRFNLEAENCDKYGACLVVSNHVTAWDPLFMSQSFLKNPVHYVASEHIFRRGFLSKLLEYFLAPIPRRKAGTAADTVMKCLRRLKAGQVVCLYAEGEASWNGVSAEVYPATGKLARTAGVPLVTYRLEGGYLSVPRWNKKIRRGRIRGRVVNVYSPEQLKAMKPADITAAINRDIYENAWDRQREEHVKFKAKNRAEGIERAFFLCPKCGSLGGVKGVGNHIRCSCGWDVEYTEEGLLYPAEPFEDLAQWDRWQTETFRVMDFEEDEPMFSDEGLRFVEIDEKHGEIELGQVKLSQYPKAICCDEHRFEYADINEMSMVKHFILLFSVGDRYYELRSKDGHCVRKYLAAWQRYKAEKGEESTQGL